MPVNPLGSSVDLQPSAPNDTYSVGTWACLLRPQHSHSHATSCAPLYHEQGNNCLCCYHQLPLNSTDFRSTKPCRQQLPSSPPLVTSFNVASSFARMSSSARPQLSTRRLLLLREREHLRRAPRSAATLSFAGWDARTHFPARGSGVRTRFRPFESTDP